MSFAKLCLGKSRVVVVGQELELRLHNPGRVLKQAKRNVTEILLHCLVPCLTLPPSYLGCLPIPSYSAIIVAHSNITADITRNSPTAPPNSCKEPPHKALAPRPHSSTALNSTMSTIITACKFVGTVSLGLLTVRLFPCLQNLPS